MQAFTYGYLSNLVSTHEVAVVVTFFLALAWLISEYFARTSTWKQGAPKKPSAKIDHGTYSIIAIGVLVSLFADILGFISGIGNYFPTYMVPMGIIVLAIGLVVRQWALRTLGQFFTMPITIAKDHKIIQNGLYKWIRHPSYTGGFLTILGISIALGSVLGVVITVIAGLAVYMYRIKIEEATLRSHFGKEYDNYSKSTYRMFPGIY